MKIQDIKEVISLLDNSNIMEFKIKDGDFELSIRSKDYSKVKAAQMVQTAPQQTYIPQVPVPVQQQQVNDAFTSDSGSTAKNNTSAESNNGDSSTESTDNLVAIKSPIVGTFYRSSSPDKPPFVKVGDVINTGDVVCIVEAMKLFNEIESEVSGKIVKVEIEDATPVEYDKVLFWVSPE